MKKRLFFQAGILLACLYSCSAYKSVPYFQDLKRSNTAQETIQNFSSIVIQPQDVLSVSVTSMNSSAWQDTVGTSYTVSEKGFIQLPLLGDVQVAGITTADLQSRLKNELSPKYLRNATVNVKIMNFKVSVLGDVLRPDVFRIPSPKATILEALSLAGDLNITAVRKNVLLVREVNGKRAYINVDLTSAGLFQSDAYYLKNNDVIYVQPDKTKFAQVDGGYRTWSLLLSGLSIVAIVLANTL